MKKPEECINLTEIRDEIDRLDQQVIELLGRRFAFVKAASSFKTSELSVKAPKRVKTMLAQRRIWAAAEGINPDIIEKIYQDLINYFIKEEFSQWKNASAKE